VKITQEDANEYLLVIDLEELAQIYVGPEEARLFMRTEQAIELYDAMREMFDEYIAERDAAHALVRRGLGPNGGPHPDDVAAERALLAPDDPKRPGYGDDLRAAGDALKKNRKEHAS
jgi:hypothetical protein